MICAGRSEVRVSDIVGNNYTFNVVETESVTSFYGWGWREFLCKSDSRPGDFIMFEMTNNSDRPIRVGPCNSATTSQIINVQAGTSSVSYSESSDEEPDEGYMIFIFSYVLLMMQYVSTLNKH
jgi:hypothetical protein